MCNLRSVVKPLCLALVALLMLAQPVFGQSQDTSPPQNLQVTLQDGVVTLSWDAPANGTDAVVGYQILRRRPRAGEQTLLVFVTDTGTTDTTYADPTANEVGQRYTYRVKAVLARDQLSKRSNFVRIDITTTGPVQTPEPTLPPVPTPSFTFVEIPPNADPELSSLPQVGTHAVPSPPNSSFIAATHELSVNTRWSGSQHPFVTVSWHPPNDGGSPINGYGIRWRELNSDAWNERMVFYTDITLDSMSANSYQFQVRARNSEGWGDWSSTKFYSTPQHQRAQGNINGSMRELNGVEYNTVYARRAYSWSSRTLSFSWSHLGCPNYKVYRINWADDAYEITDGNEFGSSQKSYYEEFTPESPVPDAFRQVSYGTWRIQVRCGGSSIYNGTLVDEAHVYIEP